MCKQMQRFLATLPAKLPWVCIVGSRARKITFFSSVKGGRSWGFTYVTLTRLHGLFLTLRDYGCEGLRHSMDGVRLALHDLTCRRNNYGTAAASQVIWRLVSNYGNRSPADRCTACAAMF